MTVYHSRSITITTTSSGAIGNAIERLIGSAVNPTVTTLVDSGCVIIGSSDPQVWVTYS